MERLTLSPILLVCTFHFVSCMVGYDCGGRALNVTTFSLLEVGECETPDTEPTKEDRYIQLLQLSEYDNADVIQCKIEVDRTIYYCGMHSHTSVVHNGRKQYLLDVSHQTCKQLHITGMFTLGNNAQITGLKVNNTESRSVTLAGSIGVNGACSGTQYSDPYGTWDNVVVQSIVKISLQNYRASIKIPTNQIVLRSGVHCPVPEGSCLDSDGGDSFWSVAPDNGCSFNSYDVLYEGPATKLQPKNSSMGPVVYTVTTRETTFALTQSSEISLCGYTILKTEHPKLFIMETTKGRTFKVRNKISVDNLDIFTYVNSKFIYVEKHMRTQITELYRDMVQQKCALEKQVLNNALALAAIAPDEVAYAIMKGPGYIASVAGEAVHIVKCVPVNTKIRRAGECYRELPVTHENSSYFLTPKSRILTQHGTLRECNELLPIMYNMQGIWYKFLPQPVESTAPPSIQPLSRPKWRYSSPQHLATSGIYSNEDLDKLREHIMFPIEKPAILNTLTRGAMGRGVQPGTVSLYNLLDEESLDKIAESTGKKLWSGFIQFGSASAGVIGIFMIIRLIKLVVDTIIHGYALHSIYGWSLHLIGALWSSITHLLLHLGTRKPPNEGSTDVERGRAHKTQQTPQNTTDQSTPHDASGNEETHANDIPTLQRKYEHSYAELRSRLSDSYA